jgi:hypothetical protein
MPESYFLFAAHSVMFITSDEHATFQPVKPIGL